MNKKLSCVGNIIDLKEKEPPTYKIFFVQWK